jgi:hypothetical protein
MPDQPNHAPDFAALLRQLEELCCLERDLTLSVHRSKICGEFAALVATLIPALRRAVELEVALRGLIQAVEIDANDDTHRGISGFTGARLTDARAALAREGPNDG